jgi:hypothetical protein
MSAQLPLGLFSSIAIAFLTPTELTLFKFMQQVPVILASP